MYVGPRKLGSVRKVIDVDEAEISVGEMVAIYEKTLHESLKCWPIIGEVLATEVEDDTQWIEVDLWSGGSYSAKWKPMKSSRKIVQWVTREAVIMYGFVLVSGDRLRPATREKLKELHSIYVPKP